MFRCRGNIILDLDQAGATGLLLELIQQGQSARIAKDQEFYLGIYPTDSDDSSKVCSDFILVDIIDLYIILKQSIC